MTAMTEAVRKTCALVVEDDPNIVDLIRSNLAVRGFDTIVSVDGMRALQLLETEDPDIVLLDLMLPKPMASSSAARSASGHRWPSSWYRPAAASGTR